MHELISQKRWTLVKKTAALLLVIFVWSMVAIALDQHDEVYSSTCPICHTKNLINGNQGTFVLEINFVPTFFYSTEKVFDGLIPVSLPFESRAPPSLSQV